MNATTYIVHTDGGSRGNPGPSAAAYIISDRSGNNVREGGEYIGVGTNNRAEYTAVLLALQAAVDVATPDSKLDFKIDSLMVVSELNGTYKVRNRELWPLHEQILALTKKFKKVTFTHIPREQNTAADAQVNKILNAHGA